MHFEPNEDRRDEKDGNLDDKRPPPADGAAQESTYGVLVSLAFEMNLSSHTHLVDLLVLLPCRKSNLPYLNHDCD